MNCRSDDMAVLVRNTLDSDCMRREMGATIRVRQMGYVVDVGAVWREKGRPVCRHCGETRWFLDADLQPLRGREDETVREIIAELTA